ncbi:MAG: S1 RNA-binding domain-containing protein [bacterium]|nr:S1 RNA-binding domain-containing protein [bacterium]
MSKKKSSVKKLQQVDESSVMGQLLAKSSSKLPSLTVGQHVTGVVIEAGNKILILDIGAKAEGLVLDLEFEAASSFIKSLSVGDKVDAVVVTSETINGQSLLSVREASQEVAWKLLEEARKNQTDVEVSIVEQTRGGLTVDAYGVEGFIPASQISAQLSKKQNTAGRDGLAGRTIKAKVTDINIEGQRVVLSERAVSESELIAQQEKAIQSIKEGEEFTGKIVGVVNFGLFVQIQKEEIALEGLVHLSEISWQKIGDPTTLFETGQKVNVIVIGKEPGRLALSIRRTQVDPWGELSKKYTPETKVKGSVTRVTDSGIYIELEPGIDGLLRHGKIPADMSIKAGDTVDVFVEETDVKNHKISLGVALKSKPVGYK